MTLNNLIKKTTIINESYPASKLNVFLCFNDRYSLQAGVTVTSLLKHNPEISIHLFMIDVSDINKKHFGELSNYKNRIIFYDIDSTIISQKYNLKDRHIPTCLRIFIPELLNELETLIYLDSDILCLSSLMPLIEMDFADNSAIVIKDDESSQQTQCELFDIPYNKYFNAGVIVINIENWNKNQISEKAIDLLDRRRKEFRLLDQDALNIALNHRTILVSEKFNKIVGIEHGNVVPETTDDDVLVHFAGPIKPWFSDTIPEIYKTYLQASPWHHIELEKSPKESKSKYRVKAKEEFKKKNFLQAARYFALYIVNKVIK